MTLTKILLVEDEESISEAIRLNLELDNYAVVSVANGRIALEKFAQEKFDLILLDVMLPELDGFGVCKAIREQNSSVPILMLTAKNDAEDRILGLKLGADDYLSKPFNLEELLLRVEKLLARTNTKQLQQINSILNIGKNSINTISYVAHTWNDLEIDFTQREVKLLKLLYEKAGQVVSREYILEEVWGHDVFPTTRTIDNYILNFRKYFEEDSKNPYHFHSVRGVGYKLVI